MPSGRRWSRIAWGSRRIPGAAAQTTVALSKRCCGSREPAALARPAECVRPLEHRLQAVSRLGPSRVGAKMPLPGLSGAAAERYGATPSSAGGPMPYRFNEPHRHKIPRARYRVQNWPEYDRALQRRGDLTVWVTPEAIAA